MTLTEIIIWILNFLNNNQGFVTFLVGLTAFVLYFQQKSDNKRDAAKIILQEIRRAEDIINEYKEHGGYKFTKKIIATDSWAKNIHHFVGDLAQDELDKISGLYSTGKYLDSIIVKVSDQNFESQIQLYKNEIQQIISGLQTATQNRQSTAAGAHSGGQIIDQSQQIIQKALPIKIQIPPPWKTLLDEISYNYEPIYHLSICEKLKKIAKIK
ncbi:hypothetical protein KJ695_03450 [Patescibacteria group bacterium]|nr:hypothetical protein [Patescibacteria group bacterium]MBU4056936.1 hypothetical protein [Patescibacteria group bacterium]MBU4368799.1 hypothetical protein [Patescibacteria group bacterium]